jgi:sugar lactone lactonase YvrE
LKRAFATLSALFLLFGGFQAFAGGMVRIKWVASIYSDAIGVGLEHPEGVACGDDSLLVADSGNSRLVRYHYEGPSVTAESEIPLPKSYPIMVQETSRGGLFYLDGSDRRIVALKANGEKIGVLDPQGLPSSAKVVPKSFRIDENDDIYILDIFSGQVLVLDPDGKFTRRIAYPEGAGFISDLAVDRQGTVFIVDSVAAVVHSAARGAERFSPLTESLKEYLNFPSSLAVDAAGVLYLVDKHGSGLGIIGKDGDFLGRTLGMGWKEGGLYYPSHICVSPNGNVFIADRSNSRVQYFSAGKE